MYRCLLAPVLLLFTALLFPCPGRAEELNFAEILAQAITNSYDLKLGGLDVEIGEQRLAEAGAMYWPALSLRFGNEYLHDLSKDVTGTVLVGDTLISGNESTWQHSASLNAEYLLYDFGARPRKYRNVERGVILAEHAKAQQLLDLKVDVLSLYGNGLRVQKKFGIWSSLLSLRREVYRFTQRLVEAGNRGRLEQGNAAIAVAEALQTCETLRLEMTAVLERLTYYTGKSYSLAAVHLSDFPQESGNDLSADVLHLPEIRAYDVAIEQKKTEYEVAWRQWLPTLTLYSAYHMYGNDSTTFSSSLENLAERNAVIGVVLKINLFNGFSDRAKVARLDTELRRLQVEKAKKVAEYEQELRTLTQKNMLAAQGLDDWRAYGAALEEQSSMGERLAEQQILDRISWLQQQDEQLEKQLTLELASVDRAMNALHLRMLAEGASS
jgi:outer membrane protein